MERQYRNRVLRKENIEKVDLAPYDLAFAKSLVNRLIPSGKNRDNFIQQSAGVTDLSTYLDLMEDHGAFGNLEDSKKKKIAEIDAYFYGLVEGGVVTSIGGGIRMRGGFDDALTVKEAANFLQAQGATEMTLKDVERNLHTVTIADGLTVSDEIGNFYLGIWQIRESRVALVNAATTVSQVQAYTAWQD